MSQTPHSTSETIQPRQPVFNGIVRSIRFAPPHGALCFSSLP